MTIFILQVVPETWVFRNGAKLPCFAGIAFRDLGDHDAHTTLPEDVFRRLDIYHESVQNLRNVCIYHSFPVHHHGQVTHSYLRILDGHFQSFGSTGCLAR